MKVEQIRLPADGAPPEAAHFPPTASQMPFPYRSGTRPPSSVTFGLFDGLAGPATRLVGAMRYATTNGATSSCCPVICLSALPAGCRTDGALNVAAVECLHAYSLIHDDLPAMDDAATPRRAGLRRLRRGDGHPCRRRPADTCLRAVVRPGDT